MTLFQLSYSLLWALAIVLIPISVVLVYLLAQLEERFKREGSGYGNNLIGRKMPSFSAVDASGATRSIHQFPDQVHVVLAVSPDCGSCRSLLQELSFTSSRDLEQLDLLVVCMGEMEQCRLAISDVRSVPVYMSDVRDDSTIDLWHAGFPAALVVDETGIVVDVRHPLSVKSVVSAIENATVSGQHFASESGRATT